MSEYVTVEIEFSENPDIVELTINQVLTLDKTETYKSAIDGEIGSPLAQMLFAAVDGVAQLVISEDSLTITRDKTVPWEVIIDEVRDALRDWYL